MLQTIMRLRHAAAASVLLALPFLAAGHAHAACFPDVSGGSPSGTCTAQTTYLHNGIATPVDDGAHPFPVNASVNASIAGFSPSATGARMTPVSVTTSDSSGTLPTGAVVVVSNVGTTNPMYCNVNGVAATTSDQLISAASWFAFTIPSGITTLHCIATGGSTTADGVGGTGLPTGAGGGSGSGGGGGAVYGPTAVGSAAANPPVLAGGTADGTATGNVGVLKIVSGIGSLNTAQVNGVTTLAGAGATGTGSQRVTAAQDTSTIAGSAPGTAGTPSANVMTVQGPTSGGTAVPVSGTVAVTGVATAANQTNVQGTVAAGTAAANSQLGGCVYNSSPPAPSNGQGLALQCDSASNLRVTGGVAQGSTTSGQAQALIGGAVTTSAPSYTTGQTSPVSLDTSGNVRVNVTNSSVAVTQATASSLNATVVGTGTFAVQSAPTATASGGATPASILSANSTNATTVKASAGTLYHISVQNSSTSALGYIIFFNTASTPTCTGTPYYGPVLIPYVGSTGNNGSGVVEDIAVGINFSTGISYCITTAPGGTGSVAANAITGGLGYK